MGDEDMYDIKIEDVNAIEDRVALMESLFGIIPSDIDFEKLRLERILKKGELDPTE